MIQRTLARKLFIAVNNPWLCSINDDPTKMSKEFADIFGGDVRLTDRLQVHTTFDVVLTDDSPFPKYNIEMRLEAYGTKTAIDIGKIEELFVKDMELIIKIDKGFSITFPTDCEDLDSLAYRMRGRLI